MECLGHIVGQVTVLTIFNESPGTNARCTFSLDRRLLECCGGGGAEVTELSCHDEYPEADKTKIKEREGEMVGACVLQDRHEA